MGRIQSRNFELDSAPSHSVDVMRTFNQENHTARVAFDLSDSPPYLVQRIEFLGLHKFSDRYVRRRILLREGHPVDERALEAGLLRLARTGYFKPIRKEDIRVQLDEAAHTANILIHLEEIGQQRASLVGGTSQFGSTLGIAYTVFDLLNREELLSAQLDGGPESLQIMLGLAKEGIFGTRASLAFSVRARAIFLLPQRRDQRPLDLPVDQHRFASRQLHPLAHNHRISARLSLECARRDARKRSIEGIQPLIGPRLGPRHRK